MVWGIGLGLGVYKYFCATCRLESRRSRLVSSCVLVLWSSPLYSRKWLSHTVYETKGLHTVMLTNC